ncbi:MAG TPA: MarR family winged helix-turn-helix transcriptional regulator [Thermoanaerobaculia bacterium]|nr:MarR family winged helix-turn-helix transcriptional regulator [Thermoanaerobaculia bacterium]
MTDSQRILDAIRRMVRLLRLSDRAAQSELGLSAAQLFVLHEVAKTPEISLKELAERTRTDQSSVSVVVARLCDEGLLARERASDDARRLVITPTRAGRAATKKAPRVAQQELVEILDAMPERERKRFADTLTAIVNGLDQGEEPAPMFFEEGK